MTEKIAIIMNQIFMGIIHSSQIKSFNGNRLSWEYILINNLSHFTACVGRYLQQHASWFCGHLLYEIFIVPTVLKRVKNNGKSCEFIKFFKFFEIFYPIFNTEIYQVLWNHWGRLAIVLKFSVRAKTCYAVIFGTVFLLRAGGVVPSRSE